MIKCPPLASLAVLAASCGLLLGGAGPGGSSPPPDPAIAYVYGGVKVMNADGTNQRTVVSLQRGESVAAPTWSPDNSRLAFYGNLGAVPGVYTVALSGGLPGLVATCAPWTAPDWSATPAPDGQYKIAFTDRVAYPGFSDIDVFLVNPDGSGRINLTNTPNIPEWAPTWAPDGRRLAVARSTGIVILEIGIVSGGLAVVNETVAFVGTGTIPEPRWANHSETLAFSLVVGNINRAATLDLDDPAGIPVLLTSNPTGFEEWSSFSPDDHRVVYVRGGGGGGIYTINPNGTDDRQSPARARIPAGAGRDATPPSIRLTHQTDTRRELHDTPASVRRADRRLDRGRLGPVDRHLSAPRRLHRLRRDGDRPRAAGRRCEGR